MGLKTGLNFSDRAKLKKFLAAGLEETEIARALGATLETVQGHAKALKPKPKAKPKAKPKKEKEEDAPVKPAAPSLE